MSSANKLRNAEEIDRLFERATDDPGQDKLVNEFLRGFEKDYKAQVKQRKKDEGK